MNKKITKNMKQYVYVLVENWNYDGSSSVNVGVYKTEEQAKRACEKLKQAILETFDDEEEKQTEEFEDMGYWWSVWTDGNWQDCRHTLRILMEEVKDE